MTFKYDDKNGKFVFTRLCESFVFARRLRPDGSKTRFYRNFAFAFVFAVAFVSCLSICLCLCLCATLSYMQRSHKIFTDTP